MAQPQTPGIETEDVVEARKGASTTAHAPSKVETESTHAALTDEIVTPGHRGQSRGIVDICQRPRRIEILDVHRWPVGVPVVLDDINPDEYL